MKRNIAIYPWFKFFQSLTFWQATWFLYFESQLSAAEAVLLYVVFDMTTTVLEVPSGYMSDRLGRKLTLLVAGFCGVCAAVLLIIGGGFAQLALANAILGAAFAFNSGTDSSLLYESLRAEGRELEIEHAELRAWRISFIALAISALAGGFLATYDAVLPYIATAISAGAVFIVTTRFHEPRHTQQTNHHESVRAIKASITQPTLLWLLCLSLAMYVFSHIPYVFGQPFIREALTKAGYASQTPLVSGSVTFVMMFISVAVSWVAFHLRNRMGLPKLLLFAFAMQILLAAALAISNGLFVITLLLFRMVPDSLSQPFIKARIQPLLQDGIRATYISIQSLAGRILFALTLCIAAGRISGDVLLPYDELQMVLSFYVCFGLLIITALSVVVRKAEV